MSDQLRDRQFLAVAGGKQAPQRLETAARILVHVLPQGRNATLVAGRISREIAKAAVSGDRLPRRRPRAAGENERKGHGLGRRSRLLGQPEFVVPDFEDGLHRGVDEEVPERRVRIGSQRPAPVARQLSSGAPPFGAVGDRLEHAVEPDMPRVVLVHQRFGAVVHAPDDEGVLLRDHVAPDLDLGLDPDVAGCVEQRGGIFLGGVRLALCFRKELERQSLGDRIVRAAGEGCRQEASDERKRLVAS